MNGINNDNKNKDMPIKVRYKYKNELNGDLVCDLTEYFDKYLIRPTDLFKTYIYNDIGVYSDDNILQVAYRVPRSNKRWDTTKKIK